MKEQVWRHRFIQALVTIIRDKTGLGEAMSFDLAFSTVDTYWREFSQYPTPETAAIAAYEELRK